MGKNRPSSRTKSSSSRYVAYSFAQLFLVRHIEVKSIEYLYEILDKYIPKALLTAQVDYFTQSTYETYVSGE